MAVDLALAKQHIRVLHNDEDSLIEQYLAAAIAWVENYTGKLLKRRETRQTAADFAAYLPLFFGPDPDGLAITYADTNGQPQTITDAKIVDARAYPASSWPSIAAHTPLTLTYTAGYTETPADLDSAVLLLVGHWYRNREAVNIGNIVQAVDFAVEALCRPYRALRV